MKIDILTLFPEIFTPLNESIIGKARESGKIEINVIDIRTFSKDKHKRCDDYTFGGGEGLLMMCQPLFDCIESVKDENSHIIYMSPKGETLKQNKVFELSKYEHLIVICGHYEGIDQRVIDTFVDEEISIGDYILTGGELPAMVMVDAISRYIPEVLGNENSAKNETFSEGMLEFPQYTRPQNFRGQEVPEILLSGHHKKIEEWRKLESENLTRRCRPDLLPKKE